MPDFRVEFYAFANVNSTIRLRDGVMSTSASRICWKARQKA